MVDPHPKENGVVADWGGGESLGGGGHYSELEGVSEEKEWRGTHLLNVRFGPARCPSASQDPASKESPPKHPPPN